MQPQEPITESVPANNRTDNQKLNYTNKFKNAPEAFKLKLDNSSMNSEQKKEAKGILARLRNILGLSNNADAETVETTEAATAEETPKDEAKETMSSEEMIEALKAEGYSIQTKEEVAENQELLNKLNSRLTEIENKQASKKIAIPAHGEEKKKEDKSLLNKEQVAQFDLLANAINRK